MYIHTSTIPGIVLELKHSVWRLLDQEVGCFYSMSTLVGLFKVKVSHFFPVIISFQVTNNDSFVNNYSFK